MSDGTDDLLHACLLLRNSDSFKDSTRALAIEELLQMATLCAQLATRYAAEPHSADQAAIRTDCSSVYSRYTRLTAAMQKTASFDASQDVLVPPWQAPTQDNAGPGQIDLSSEAVQDLIEHLVPLLHEPVHTSIIRSVIDSVMEPLNTALCPRIFATVKARLLDDLREPLVESAVPLLQENLLQFILGDHFAQFRDKFTTPAVISSGELSRTPSENVSPRLIPPTLNSSPPPSQLRASSVLDDDNLELSAPGPSKRPRIPDPQILPPGHPPLDPFLAMPTMWQKKPSAANAHKGVRPRKSKTHAYDDAA
ncbi:hypothetical protein FKP32DRAFT_1673419 [Trametes sanguinea]|nr:hypothetical protein FKP32DRAFT_1673419 [Trametes sanguinea]